MRENSLLSSFNRFDLGVIRCYGRENPGTAELVDDEEIVEDHELVVLEQLDFRLVDERRLVLDALLNSHVGEGDLQKVRVAFRVDRRVDPLPLENPFFPFDEAVQGQLSDRKGVVVH